MAKCPIHGRVRKTGYGDYIKETDGPKLTFYGERSCGCWENLRGGWKTREQFTKLSLGG